jgi:hypothetical protein
MQKMTLKNQFYIGTGLILLLFCLGTAFLFYRFEKNNVEKEIFKETEIYIAAVDATRTYVKDVLRPRM